MDDLIKRLDTITKSDCAETVAKICKLEIERLTAQLDALRNQEPVAYFINVNMYNGQPAQYEQCAAEYNGTKDTVPLYTLNPSTTHSASLKEKK